jgi:hypothetical protein
MIRAGSTITLEAWDLKYKNNLDWNHAWGAAPANIISRFVLGVRPLEPGFGKVIIHPQPGLLKKVSGIIPTIRGPISVSLENNQGYPLELRITIPASMTAKVGVPRRDMHSDTIVIDGKKVQAELENECLFCDNISGGTHVLTCFGQE